MITGKDIFQLYGYQTPADGIHEAFRKVALDDRDETRHNRTPLHLACEWAHAGAVHILLERGADVNAKDNDGLTPLCVLGMLSPNGRFDEHAVGTIAEELLHHGARVNRSGRNTTALLEAVRNHHHDMVAAILAAGKPLDATDSRGENALHIACREAGNAAAAIRRSEQLIASWAGRWHPDKDKERIRHELEARRHEETRCNLTVKRLLESGQFDPEEKTNCGKTASDLAREYGAKRAGALLAGQDPETNELAAQIGGMDIFQALYFKDKEAVGALLHAGGEWQTVCEYREMHDFYGHSPLACALVWDDIEAADMLLRAGADPNYKSPEERTAFAAWIGKSRQTGQKQCLRILQQMTRYGWQPEQAVDKEGNTALSFACRHAAGEPGRTAIHYLAGIGADVNASNPQGQTPIMNLYGGRFWDGKIPLFPGLPRSYPYEGRTCGEEDAGILEFLLEAGADAGTVDQWGNTALHYIAASARHTAAKKAAELLFDFGSPDVAAVNNEGKTALDIAVEKNDEALIKILLKHA